MEHPDRWVVLKIEPVGMDPFRSVLCGWTGGNLDCERCNLSSEIKQVEVEVNTYVFITNSGNRYQCPQASYGFTNLSASTLNWLQNTPGATVTIDEAYGV